MSAHIEDPNAKGVTTCSLNKWGPRAVHKLGHDVTLLCGGDGKKRKEYTWNGIKVIELPVRFELTPTSRIIKGFAKELMNIDADVFHTHYYCSFIPEITAIIGKIRGIPTFTTFHNTFTERKGLSGLLEKIYILLMQPILPLYTKVFFISNYVKNRPYFKSIKENKKIILRNYLTKLPKLKIKRKKNTILYVGSVKYVKGVDLLIKAFNKLDIPKLELNIVGSWKGHESYKQHLDSLVKKPRINFLGFLHGTKKWQQFYSNTILVVPSRAECFNNVVIEGMACNIPVIVSNRDALPETLDGHGLVANLNDENDLANKISLLLKDEKLRKKFVKEGKKYSKKYSYDMGKQLVKDYGIKT